MTIRRSSPTRYIALTAIVVCAHLPAFAQDGCPGSGQLRVLSSNGVKAVVEETLSEIEQAIGCGLDLEFSTAASLARRIESGERSMRHSSGLESSKPCYQALSLSVPGRDHLR